MDTKRIISTRLTIPSLLLVLLLAALLLPAQPRAASVHDSGAAALRTTTAVGGAEKEMGQALPGGNSDAATEEIQRKLEQKVTVDFAEGTDIRDVLTFLAGRVNVNIVLDERVMLRPGALPVAVPRADAEGQRGAHALVSQGGGGGAYRPVRAEIRSELRRLYLKDLPLKDALKAFLSQQGLDYRVQPDFIWVSTPDVLRYETFEPIYTRSFKLEHARSDQIAREMIPILPQVFQPYTDRRLSSVEFSPKDDLLTVRNTLSNLKRIEEMNKAFYLLPGDRSGADTGTGTGAPEKVASAKIEKIRKKLEQRVSIDFAGGTDIRDVFTFFADYTGVNVVLDERVMLDSPRGAVVSEGGKAAIQPTVEGKTPKIYLKNMQASEALRAIFVPMGLEYKVQPDFIWVSRPDILPRESFEPLETRWYLLQHARGDEVMPKLRALIPDVIEAYTGRALSYMDWSSSTRQLVVHNTPSNLEMIEHMVKVLDHPVAKPDTRGSDAAEKALESWERALADPQTDAAIRSVLERLEAMEEKLQAPVSIDFVEGTEISAVLIFLNDYANVNIVLDERVMLPPAMPRLPKGGLRGLLKGEGPTSSNVPEATARVVSGAAPPETQPAIPSESAKGVIRATIRRETPRIYLKNLPLSQALRGLLVPMGLDYKVQPDFVWISRPDVLQSETFEPLYTRAFRLQHIRADVVIPKLRAAVPDITERYTRRTLSYVESAGANGNVLAIHQTPSNLKRIEELLKVLDLPG